MANTLPKWTEERTNQLITFVGEGLVTQETVAAVAADLETSVRSISSKLRKLGYEVELVSAKKPRFSDEQTEALSDLVLANSGNLTYSEISEAFEDGKFDPKQIQGKILSMELTEHVKATPKPELEHKYTSGEDVIFVKMATEGAFIEDIAVALGKELNSVRGKALSMLRNGSIEAIPKQKVTKAASAKVDALGEIKNIASLTVEEIAEAINKTVKGVKTMLTRRGIKCSNYDGEAKKAKIESAEVA